MSSKELLKNGEEAAVETNQRALIEKILARCTTCLVLSSINPLMPMKE
jgi:hypothetical protein